MDCISEPGYEEFPANTTEGPATNHSIADQTRPIAEWWVDCEDNDGILLEMEPQTMQSDSTEYIFLHLGQYQFHDNIDCNPTCNKEGDIRIVVGSHSSGGDSFSWATNCGGQNNQEVGNCGKTLQVPLFDSRRLTVSMWDRDTWSNDDSVDINNCPPGGFGCGLRYVKINVGMATWSSAGETIDCKSIPFETPCTLDGNRDTPTSDDDDGSLSVRVGNAPSGGGSAASCRDGSYSTRYTYC